MLIVVNPSDTQFGAVVETVGGVGVVSLVKLINTAEAAEVQVPIVEVIVYAVPIVAPVIVPPALAVGPIGEKV